MHPIPPRRRARRRSRGVGKAGAVKRGSATQPARPCGSIANHRAHSVRRAHAEARAGGRAKMFPRGHRELDALSACAPQKARCTPYGGGCRGQDGGGHRLLLAGPVGATCDKVAIGPYAAPPRARPRWRPTAIRHERRWPRPSRSVTMGPPRRSGSSPPAPPPSP